MMNDIEVLEPERPTNLEEIAEFERLIRAKLPEDYKQFLLKHNGGHPVMDTFDLVEPINKNNTTVGVAWFYALYEGQACNLSLKFEISRDRLPEEYIPIAYDSGGDLCIVVKGENYGQVHYWTTNWSVWNEEDYNYLYFVSNTFTEFINGLYELKLADNGDYIRREQNGKITIIPASSPLVGGD
jgi:hypothetical protein